MTTPLDRTGSPNPFYQDSDPTADISFSQSALQQSATLTSNDASIMQREREITEIAKGIIELADIFKELQTMVIDQGTMLDRIDYNVEQMSVHVKAADKEMAVVCSIAFYKLPRGGRLLIVLGLNLPTKDHETENNPPTNNPHNRPHHPTSHKTQAQCNPQTTPRPERTQPPRHPD